ncbi:Protein MOTHER of FT and TFL1 [Bienertia sinuspersici]
MAEVVDVLKAGKVIGDVVDSFTPVVELRVQYGSTTVSNGCEIKPLEAQNRPHLQVATEKPHRDNLYTLFMVDPDAPDPSKPVLKEWLHW